MSNTSRPYKYFVMTACIGTPVIHVYEWFQTASALNVYRERSAIAPQAWKRRGGAKVDLENTVEDDARPDACFVRIRKPSLICWLAPRLVADVPDGRHSRDIIKEIERVYTSLSTWYVVVQYPADNEGIARTLGVAPQ